MTCRICGAATVPAGAKQGTHCDREFRFERCPACAFTFVANPWTDYARIYNEAYYRGQGPDPWIDYVFELEHPERTVRIHEWRGIAKLVNSLRPVNAQTRWIDFGCGNGGLVRHVRAAAGCQIVGFEEGWVAGHARGFGIPILNESELAAHAGTCDVVTAIEVIEHVEDPVAVLRRIRALLKPGGLLFLTTGNAAPYRDRFLEWGYNVPEIHISFFEPATLRTALEKAGFRADFRGFLPGFEDILRYKILKNLKKREAGGWESMLPWSLLTRLADRSRQVTAHPIGWAE
jgi:SAM-dependent methyltransferase